MDLESSIDELIDYMEHGTVVPLVGPELAVVEHEGRREPYQRVLGRKLAQRLGVVVTEEAVCPSEVMGAWLAGNPRARRQNAYRELYKPADALPVEIPPALLHLARIRDLQLFGSFCTDGLLTRAINQERFGGATKTLELAFTPGKANDLPDTDLEFPLVYHLFGRMSVLPNYVMAEEDVLEWVAALHNPTRQPTRLLDTLSKSHLLFLGWRYSDWLGRFLLRIARNRKMSDNRSCYEYLVDDGVCRSDPLVIFLSRYSNETQVLAVNAESFVEQLAMRWAEVRTEAGDGEAQPDPGPMAPAMPAGSIFISYASEDRTAALHMAAALQALGLPVWLDRERLDWGTEYDRRIEEAIRRCSLFLAVLSRTAEQRTGYFRKEWAWAEDRSREFTGSTLSFLLPVVIDDTPVFSSREIPSFFRKVHIESAPQGRMDQRLQELVVAAYWSMKAHKEGR